MDSIKDRTLLPAKWQRPPQLGYSHSTFSVTSPFDLAVATPVSNSLSRSEDLRNKPIIVEESIDSLTNQKHRTDEGIAGQLVPFGSSGKKVVVHSLPSASFYKYDVELSTAPKPLHADQIAVVCKAFLAHVLELEKDTIKDAVICTNKTILSRDRLLNDSIYAFDLSCSLGTDRGNVKVAPEGSGWRKIFSKGSEGKPSLKRWVKLSSFTCVTSWLATPILQPDSISDSGSAFTGRIWLKLSHVSTNDMKDELTCEKLTCGPEACRTLDDYITSELSTKLTTDPRHEPIVHGNRIFTQTLAVERGLEVKIGALGRLGLSQEGKNAIVSCEISRYFFKQQLIADFINDYFGTNSGSFPQHQADELTKLLRGLHVYVTGAPRRQPVVVSQINVSPARSILIERQGIAGSIDIATLFARKGKRLRFPDMPCVGVGSHEKPLWYPAEACMIAPGQSFGHGTPLTRADPAFATRSIKSVDFKPRVGDPFPKESTKHFRIIFVSIKTPAHTPSDTPVASVDKAVLEVFAHELGNRFNGALERAVKRGRGTELSFTPSNDTSHIWLRALHELRDGGSKMQPGPKSVVIAVIPSGAHEKETYKLIKRLSENDLGFQCCCVSSRALVSYYRQVSSGGMVKYTGQIARKIFARALMPGQRTASNPIASVFAATILEQKTQVEKGLVAGLHVVCLKDLYAEAKCKQDDAARTDLENSYLITVISSAVWLDDDMFTTHHVAYSENLESYIAQCFVKHMQDLGASAERSTFTHGVLYRSGHGSADKEMTKAEMEYLNTLTHRVPELKSPHYVYITVKPETQVRIVPGESSIYQHSARNELATLHSYLAGSRAGEWSLVDSCGNDFANTTEAQFDQHATDTFGLDTALQTRFARVESSAYQRDAPFKVAVYRTLLLVEGFKDMSHSERMNVHAIERHRAQKQGFDPVEELISFRFLVNAALPDILYLAQKASNRARLHMRRVDPTIESVDDDRCPYMLPQAHGDLRFKSLYFL